MFETCGRDRNLNLHHRRLGHLLVGLQMAVEADPRSTDFCAVWAGVSGGVCRVCCDGGVVQVLKLTADLCQDTVLAS